MSSRSRRQTRQRLTTGWAPEQHNESVRRRKELRAIGRSITQVRSSMRHLAVALVGFGEAATALSELVRERQAQALDDFMRERERQAQIAWVDRMAVLGFDMRDEHDALERGELLD